jgi:hypothetical protein
MLHIVSLRRIALVMTTMAILGFSGTCPAEEKAPAAEEKQEEAPPRKLPELAPGAWEPIFELGQSIYPSFAISTATLKEGMWDDKEHLGDPWGTIGVAVRGDADDCPVAVQISGGKFFAPSIYTGRLPDKSKVYCIYPDLKYDYDKLISVKQTVPEPITFRVTVNGKAYPEKTVRVQVRPVNECVSGFTDSSGSYNDVGFLFAAYVNENHPFINKILKEAAASGKVDGLSGYQGEKEDVKSEIEAVWNTLKARGLSYSSITTTEDEGDPYIDTQYMRLLGESLHYAQANCADGSALMASIFRRMELNVSLVMTDNHMLIAVSLDKDGNDLVFIETTAISDSTLDEAIEAGNEVYEENRARFESDKDEDHEFKIIDVQAARSMGIMPIKDSSVG